MGNMHNLTEEQQDVMRWIVQKVRKGYLREDFSISFSWSSIPLDYLQFDSGSRGGNLSDHPFISEGILNALAASDMILVKYFGKQGKRRAHCTILRKAYRAVDSNFPDSVFGILDKKYRYDLFVLMPFTSELKPIYDNHLKKVAKQLGLSISRADDFFSQNSIIEEVWSAIAQATILIADCTGKNPNVFYEIGLAHAIGKPVIIITQNADDVPFDLRHRRYILYAYTPPGMEKFEGVLLSTILEAKKDLGMPLDL
jgi:hypothetical protein